MTVALPTSPYIQDAVPRFLNWGSQQKPPLGGSTTQIERVGSRFALEVKMPLMKPEVGRPWVAALIEGMADGAVSIEWPQPDFTPSGNAMAAIKTAISGGTTIALKGLAASTQALTRGQFISITHAGRSFLHMVAGANYTANGSGEATILIEPPLRTAVSEDDVVQIAAPIIEGYLVGDEREWNLPVARFYGLAFTIEEIE
jgi:hypothetical protein